MARVQIDIQPKNVDRACFANRRTPSNSKQSGFVVILPPPNASRYGGGFLRSAPSLIPRRRDFPGAPPGSFYPFQQVLPCFLDIDRCVDVSAMVSSTSWTVPFAHSER